MLKTMPKAKKVVATKAQPKTKTAKLPFNGKAKKITGVSNKSKLKGKPITKKTAVKKVKAK